jgi:hypothetical protein
MIYQHFFVEPACGEPQNLCVILYKYCGFQFFVLLYDGFILKGKVLLFYVYSNTR